MPRYALRGGGERQYSLQGRRHMITYPEPLPHNQHHTHTTPLLAGAHTHHTRHRYVCPHHRSARQGPDLIGGLSQLTAGQLCHPLVRRAWPGVLPPSVHDNTSRYSPGMLLVNPPGLSGQPFVDMVAATLCCGFIPPIPPPAIRC
jgi:hypothetical protein